MRTTGPSLPCNIIHGFTHRVSTKPPTHPLAPDHSGVPFASLYMFRCSASPPDVGMRFWIRGMSVYYDDHDDVCMKLRQGILGFMV
jgi:hypothetical protein